MIKNKKTAASTIKEWMLENYIVLIVYSVLFVYVSIYHRVSSFAEWDEFSHWGPMIKGMIGSNKLYTYLNINNAHPDYPPLFQCIEYLFCYIRGSYTEPSVYIGLSVFCISFYLPVLDKLSNENSIKKKVLISISFLVLVALSLTIGYSTLENYLYTTYIDFEYSVLAAISVFFVMNSEFKDRSDYIVASAFLSALLLSKELGIAFYLASIFIAFLLVKIKKNRINVKDVLFFLAIPLLVFISWKLYTREIVGQFALSKISISDIYQTLFNNVGEEWKVAVKDRFIDALFTKSIIISPIDLSFLASVIIISFIFIPSILVAYKSIKERVVIIVSYLLITIGFAFTMLVLYSSGCFSQGEVVVLASYERYMGSCINFMITLTILLIINNLFLGSLKSKVLLILISTILVVCSSQKKRIELVHNTHTYNYLDNYDYNEFRKTIEKNCPLGSKILLIDNVVFRDCVFSYYYNNKEYTIAGHSTYDEYQKDLFIDMYYKIFDYVYIINYNAPFKEAWDKTNSDPLMNHRLYKVDGITLRLVNE